MLTRDQQYAMEAHTRVTAIKARPDEKEQKSYGSLSHKLPILIHKAGLVQALTFADARGKPIHHQLLDDLAQTIGLDDRGTLLKHAREDQLMQYIYLTQQTLDALLWYKRFAQSILGVDASDSTGDDDIAKGS